MVTHSESKENSPEFDIVIVASARHNEIAAIAIHHLLKLIVGFRKIFLITNKSNFPFYEKELIGHVVLIDEDTVLPNLTFSSLHDILSRSNCQSRTGWYFQQFLKMGISNNPQISDHYLIWDADTVPLRPLHFFNENGQTLINLKEEFNPPYFTTMKKLLGLDKAVEKSFIAEHMMIQKSIMQELITKISDTGDWPNVIINSIEKAHLPLSGFSEFETYGTYLLKYYPKRIELRELKALRSGAKKLGYLPRKIGLNWLSSTYDYASFERSHSPKVHRIAKYYIKALIFKIFGTHRRKNAQA